MRSGSAHQPGTQVSQLRQSIWKQRHDAHTFVIGPDTCECLTSRYFQRTAHALDSHCSSQSSLYINCFVEKLPSARAQPEYRHFLLIWIVLEDERRSRRGGRFKSAAHMGCGQSSCSRDFVNAWMMNMWVFMAASSLLFELPFILDSIRFGNQHVNSDVCSCEIVLVRRFHSSSSSSIR